MASRWYKHGLYVVQDPTRFGTLMFNFGTTPGFLVQLNSVLVHGTDTLFAIFSDTPSQGRLRHLVRQTTTTNRTYYNTSVRKLSRR